MAQLSRMQEITVALAPADRRAAVLAALETSAARETEIKPSDALSDSASTARFIVACNEKRLAGCPPVAPTNETAKFIVGTVAKLRARI